MEPAPEPYRHGIFAERVDVGRHAGNEAPIEAVPQPHLGEKIELDKAVIQAIPGHEAHVVEARRYATSLWGLTAKITVKYQGGAVTTDYFLKTVSTNTTPTASQMIRGEFESLLAIKKICPSLIPDPISYGSYTVSNGQEAEVRTDQHSIAFLLTCFREIARQPPLPPSINTDPTQDFVTCLATLHKSSVSPTGMFGFHTTTCHATLSQMTNTWDPSWSNLFRRQFNQMISHAKAKQASVPSENWPERFFPLADLVLEKVIPRLLEPLQSEAEGRSIKPSLVHGDLWDENTALDAKNGEPFIFDACSFYAHNEYEIGNWRARRHRLSGQEYVEGYKKVFAASEPVDEWDDRNLLYSLRFDLGAAVLIPGSDDLKETVRQNMETLCRKFFPDDVELLVAGKFA
ncbi:Fructosamine kinase domain containing protein [Naviculisporaceae sp. PSN 640]